MHLSRHTVLILTKMLLYVTEESFLLYCSKLKQQSYFVIFQTKKFFLYSWGFQNHQYLVGPYYAGPKSTPAHFTLAIIPPRENFDLPPFRAAFNAMMGKNQKKGKLLKLQEQLFRFQCVFFSRRIKFSMIKYLL